jgi:hypothetical protein
VANGYEIGVENDAKTVFTGLSFKYNHKIEDKFWDVADDDEMEEMDYMQWLIDENELNTDFSIQDICDSPQERVIIQKFKDMDEEQLETLERLKALGIQTDYYGLIDLEFLEDISGLPILSKEHRNLLHNNIIDIRYGMCRFQEETNELLRNLISPEEFNVYYNATL